jgi:hypothetical protein
VVPSGERPRFGIPYQTAEKVRISSFDEIFSWRAHGEIPIPCRIVATRESATDVSTQERAMRSKPRAATLVFRAALLAVLMVFLMLGLVASVALAPSETSESLLAVEAKSLPAADPKTAGAPEASRSLPSK